MHAHTYTQAHAKILLFCSDDLQCVSFVTQQRSVAPSLIKRLFGKEQADRNADSFSSLLVCTAPQFFENVVESIKGRASGDVSTPDSSFSRSLSCCLNCTLVSNLLSSLITHLKTRIMEEKAENEP